MQINFKDFHVHFIGIGGIGMSGIAQMLLELGCKISGSDISKGASVEKLKSYGAEIDLGHKKENIEKRKHINYVVYSSAIGPDNPEIVATQALGIPLLQRAEMLAELMKVKYGLAVAGTHGKTTTTTLLSTLLICAGKDPNHIIGGIPRSLQTNSRMSKSEIFVAEADESDGSFLHLSPVVAIITNIDRDHLDYYKNPEDIYKSFLSFANKVPFFGKCILNADDELVRKLMQELKRPYVSYAIANTEAEFEQKKNVIYLAKDVSVSSKGTSFKLYYRGEFVDQFFVPLYGKHNVSNSLAALAGAHHLGIRLEELKDYLCQFQGVHRRLEVLHTSENLEIIDDYAHHPTEISSTLECLKQRSNNHLVVIFELHRYSRSALLWKEFLHCFNMADELYLLPIYSAQEKPIAGITHERLAHDINELHPGLAKAISGREEMKSILQLKFNKMTTILTAGAGSIGRFVREFIEEIQ